jgi:hypothetical protein
MYIYTYTHQSDNLSLFRFIKGRKVKRILVAKLQNIYAVVSDGFVFIYLLNLLIGSTEQKSDLYCVVRNRHSGGACCCCMSIADSVQLMTLFSIRERQCQN